MLSIVKNVHHWLCTVTDGYGWLLNVINGHGLLLTDTHSYR